jgi:hypothetical protein
MSNGGNTSLFFTKPCTSVIVNSEKMATVVETNCKPIWKHTTQPESYENQLEPPKENDLEENAVIQLNNYNCICGVKYKNRSGLWKHKKKCIHLIQNIKLIESQPKQDDVNKMTSNEVIVTADDCTKISNNITVDMLTAFMTMMNQTQEFKEFMADNAKQLEEIKNQNKEIQTQLLELAKEGRNTIINNTTNTTNSFNLNVFLNETCKNAMNMLDYVNSLELDLTDLEETGKLGYTNGMSRIFINGLKDMDVNMRPIHCSDLKREVLYIKDDNVWEKDNENRDKLKGALRKIEKKNIMLIPAYVKAHPNCVISSNRENTPYLKMVMQSTGGENPAETADMAKIITNIAKAVVINK